jgi:DNA primase
MFRNNKIYNIVSYYCILNSNSTPTLMTKDTITKLNALSVISIAEKLGLQVKKKRALCFNHDDHDPSLRFDEKKQTFRCYVCDVKGDNIALVSKKLGLSFLDACSWLIQQFQVWVDEPYRNAKFRIRAPQPMIKPAVTPVPNPFKPNPEIYEWLIEQLTLSQWSLDYLTWKRGFSKKMITELRIRDITAPGIVFQKLIERWGTTALLHCGLLKSDGDQIKKIWWDHVIIFPFISHDQRITYLQARRMSADPSNYKYLALSQLKPAIYNTRILAALNEEDDLFICEGVPDTITAMELGMPAIGVLGAASFDDEIVDRLLPYRINIFPDTDPAGQLFVRKVRQAFYEKGKTIQERTLPKPYKDLNEYFIAKNSGSQ